ncbi:MAG: hypothetical protein V3V08_24865, partial [Nannocystaceae bacterium]
MYRVILLDDGDAKLGSFMKGLQHCYRRHNAQSAAALTSLAPDGTRTILIEDEDGRPVGGTRVQPRLPSRPLPFETVLTKLLDAQALAFLHTATMPVAEACALWRVETAKQAGIAQLLVQVAVALARSMKVKTLFGFTHQYLAPSLRPCGFLPVEGLAPLPYPDARYTSQVYVAAPMDLSGLGAEARTEIQIATSQLAQERRCMHAYRTSIEQAAPYALTLSIGMKKGTKS